MSIYKKIINLVVNNFFTGKSKSENISEAPYILFSCYTDFIGKWQEPFAIWIEKYFPIITGKNLTYFYISRRIPSVKFQWKKKKKSSICEESKNHTSLSNNPGALGVQTCVTFGGHIRIDLSDGDFVPCLNRKYFIYTSTAFFCVTFYLFDEPFTCTTDVFCCEMHF